jgi:hypothetical protein
VAIFAVLFLLMDVSKGRVAEFGLQSPLPNLFVDKKRLKIGANNGKLPHVIPVAISRYVQIPASA